MEIALRESIRLRAGPLQPQECATFQARFDEPGGPQTWVEPRGRSPRPKGAGFLFLAKGVIEMTETELETRSRYRCRARHSVRACSIAYRPRNGKERAALRTGLPQQKENENV